MRIRRDPVSGCIVSRFRDKAFKIGGRLTVRQLAEACQSVTLPNNGASSAHWLIALPSTQGTDLYACPVARSVSAEAEARPQDLAGR